MISFSCPPPVLSSIQSIWIGSLSSLIVHSSHSTLIGCPHCSHTGIIYLSSSGTLFSISCFSSSLILSSLIILFSKFSICFVVRWLYCCRSFYPSFHTSCFSYVLL